ncbi:MAG: hypothetical protein JKY37_02880 [Nannocystaceae bacterium]|nr:hypothetical protein [Nannocystaceae bacterium]
MSASTPTASDDSAEAVHRRDAVAELTRWEQQRRDETDFLRLPPWSEVAGADPLLLRRLADGSMLGLLRGDGVLVRSFDDGRPRQRTAVAHDSTGWAVTEDGTVLFVVGPKSGRVARFSLPQRADQDLVVRGGIDVTASYSLRDVAVSPRGQLAVADGYAHRVLVLAAPPWPESGTSAVSVAPTFAADCAGPLWVQWTATRLLALCSLDHTLLAWPLNAAGQPTEPPVVVEHDGPVWSVDAQPLPDGTGLRLAMGGVEDKPLDRSGGAFGNIDSFVFVTDIPDEGPPVRRAELNVSAHGAVTPKWIRLQLSGEAADLQTHVQTVGYGSEAWVTAVWDAKFSTPKVQTTALVPGITDMVVADDGSVLAANPLLDAWLSFGTDGTLSVIAAGNPEADTRSPDVRLGEALLFTGLMAPAARSEGKASRFTCETCHFEGGVDGRVHWTGRQDVHASTRPIRGLFANRPHFSRALDGTMAEMVNNEFRVASRGTGADPWFSLSPETVPWLRYLGVQTEVDGAGLRRALMAFIMVFNHEPNPRALSAEPWFDEDEALAFADVAKLFQRHCESCHQARSLTDAPESRLERSAWAGLIASPAAPIVWATQDRMRTGVEPYVHETGARVPSLRRLYAKRPYFTDGGASTLREAVARFSVGPSVGSGQHLREVADGRKLTASEQRGLLRFVGLL